VRIVTSTLTYLEFPEFVRMIEKEKSQAKQVAMDSDTGTLSCCEPSMTRK